MTIMKLEKPHAMSLTEHTARTLRKAILRGELRPGMRVVEQTIAEQMGISRGPVREAIHLLASEGLLVIHPRRGAGVRKMGPREAWEVLTLRSTLETFAVRLCFQKLHSQGTTYLHTVLGKMKMACDRADLTALVDSDLAFHGFIVDTANHCQLSTTFHALDPLLGAIHYSATEDTAISFKDVPSLHECIVSAIEHGNETEAVSVVNQHYQVRADIFCRVNLRMGNFPRYEQE